MARGSVVVLSLAVSLLGTSARAQTVWTDEAVRRTVTDALQRRQAH